jgi:hypothetical protein
VIPNASLGDGPLYFEGYAQADRTLVGELGDAAARARHRRKKPYVVLFPKRGLVQSIDLGLRSAVLYAVTEEGRTEATVTWSWLSRSKAARLAAISLMGPDSRVVYATPVLGDPATFGELDAPDPPRIANILVGPESLPRELPYHPALAVLPKPVEFGSHEAVLALPDRRQWLSLPLAFDWS